MSDSQTPPSIQERLQPFVGEWELMTDIPGAEDTRGSVVFEFMGEVLIQRTTVPAPEAPDSCCMVVGKGATARTGTATSD